MKFTLATTVFAAFAGLVTASPIEKRQVPGGTPWTLRATSYPNFTPVLNGNLEIGEGGQVGFGWTAASTGFVSHVDPVPKGSLVADASGLEAYLEPTDVAEVYDFKFAEAVPTEVGILSTSFFPWVISCGGQCGGFGLKYDTTPADDATTGQWIAVASGAGYKIQWTTSTTLPAGANWVYLWRDSA